MNNIKLNTRTITSQFSGTVDLKITNNESKYQVYKFEDNEENILSINEDLYGLPQLGNAKN